MPASLTHAHNQSHGPAPLAIIKVPLNLQTEECILIQSHVIPATEAQPLPDYGLK